MTKTEMVKVNEFVRLTLRLGLNETQVEEVMKIHDNNIDRAIVTLRAIVK